MNSPDSCFAREPRFHDLCLTRWTVSFVSQASKARKRSLLLSGRETTDETGEILTTMREDMRERPKKHFSSTQRDQ
jgi:hypothetical protein